MNFGCRISVIGFVISDFRNLSSDSKFEDFYSPKSNDQNLTSIFRNPTAQIRNPKTDSRKQLIKHEHKRKINPYFL